MMWRQMRLHANETVIVNLFRKNRDESNIRKLDKLRCHSYNVGMNTLSDNSVVSAA